MSLTDCQSLFILTWLSLDGRGRVSYRLHTVRPQCSPLHCCVTCTAHISTQTLYHKAGEFSVGVERLFPLSPGRVQGYRARVKMTTANKAAKAPQWGEGLAPAIRLWQSNSCFITSWHSSYVGSDRSLFCRLAALNCSSSCFDGEKRPDHITPTLVSSLRLPISFTIQDLLSKVVTP